MYKNFNIETDKDLILLNYYIEQNENESIIELTVKDVERILSTNRSKAHRCIKKLEELENKPQYAYYNNKLHGSFSIKKVLPIFTNLTYKTLEVKNGTEAILTYGMLPKLTEEEYQKKYLALRIYCRQDTWAMVEILRGLRKAFQ